MEFHLRRIIAYQDFACATYDLIIDGYGSTDERVFFDGEKYDYPKEGMILKPAFYLNQTQAQQLADSLYDAGIRPSEQRGGPGQLVAVEKHLADMRLIAFHKLGISGAQK